MTETTIKILVTYKDGKTIEQIRKIEHRLLSRQSRIKSVIKNKLKKYELLMKKFNNDILRIELIKTLNYEINNGLIEL